MDLWESLRQRNIQQSAPLAWRMRPKTLEEFVGQQHILGEGKLLRRAIEADKLSSAIFYGPPGTGKTALAGIIALRTCAVTESLNAVTSGVADLRAVIERARERLGMYNQRTVVFVDEIHRFNKAQQDALLPFVEDGTIILIGATTENPFFEVNAPLISRSRVFQFYPLSREELAAIAALALSDCERGLGAFHVRVDEDAFEHLLCAAGGDARALLNALELAALSTEPGADGTRRVTLQVAEESIQVPAVQYGTDAHYDHASAFIKSMRGGDPDATVFWLARMLEAGEDVRFIARRIMICAAEDVGLADPQALVVAVAAFHAVSALGMPEARIALAEAALYVALAKKSNSAYMAVEAAADLVKRQTDAQVPAHLRPGSYPGASRLGHGQGYLYPHDYPLARVQQQYLPDGIPRGSLYRAKQLGWEGEAASTSKE